MNTLFKSIQKRFKNLNKGEYQLDTGKSHIENKGNDKLRRSIRKNKSVKMNKKHKIMKSGLINTVKLSKKHEKAPSSPSISLKRTVGVKDGSIIENLKSINKNSRLRKHNVLGEAENDSRRAFSMCTGYDETSALRDKQQKIVNAFQKFKKKNSLLCKGIGIENTKGRMHKQIQYVQNLRTSLFDKQTMKNIVFKAWRIYTISRRI